MRFLKLFFFFLSSVFFLNFCGEKKSEENSKNALIEVDNKKKVNESVYRVQDESELPECTSDLENKMYYTIEEEILRICLSDEQKLFSYEIINIQGEKGQKGDSGAQGEIGSFEESDNILPAPMFSATPSGINLILTMNPLGSSKIFYTTDESTPTVKSTVFDQGITVPCCDSVTYKAFQTHWFFPDSSIGSYTVSFLYEFGFKFGSYGSSEGKEFSEPTGIAVDSKDNIYVLDYGRSDIQKFDPNGEFQNKFGSSGDGSGEFDKPEGMVIDSNDNIYVLDSNRRDIQKFNSTRAWVATFGSLGPDEGQFISPTAIAIDNENNIYVADEERNDIQKFNSSGTHLSTFNSDGSDGGDFQDIIGIALDSDGNIYVINDYQHSVQKFNAQGKFISSFGSYGPDDGQFEYPQAIAIDKENNIYVLDSSKYTIQKFNVDGKFISRFGSFGSDNGEFIYPQEIGIDKAGSLYIYDSGRYDVQKISPIND